MKTVRIENVNYDLNINMTQAIAEYWHSKGLPRAEYWALTADWHNYSQLPAELIEKARALKPNVRITSITN